MKHMMKSTKNLFLLGTAWLFGLFFLSSCLSDGEDTIALERGDPYELLLGKWKVSQALYEGEDEKGNIVYADIPEDSWLATIFDFEADGRYTETQGQNVETYPWQMDPANGDMILSLNAVNWDVVSLGKGRMRISREVSVGGVYLLKCYDLYRISSEDAEENGNGEDIGDNTVNVSSNEYSVISRNGFALTIPHGAVPLNDDGENGTVAFSMSFPEEVPYGLPSNLQAVGRIIKIEPMNFVFNSPLQMEVPDNGSDSKVHLYGYDASLNKWVLVPYSYNEQGKSVISTNRLGYFVLARETGETVYGGIHVDGSKLNDGYYYYVVISSASGSTQAQEMVGRMSVSSDRNQIYMPDLPKGVYAIRVVRQKRSSYASEAVITEYSSKTYSVAVQNTLYKGNSGFPSYTGWTNISGMDWFWDDGRPSEWGTETKTYGTGKFQATLTWTNPSSEFYTDYDLHLSGPNNLHVYYSNKKQGCFELDRDWIRDPGDAVENIYSINDNFPAGTYVVKVNHFSGAMGRLYNCRIIMNGKVVKSVSGATGDTNEIYRFVVE